MSIRIVTDSACDLPAQAVAQHGITIVPLYVNMGDQSYLDGIDLSRAEFYRQLPGLPTLPTTSAPAPGQFVQTFERLATAGATQIVCIHISASLSNTVNVAQLAAQETRGATVTVIDGGQLSLGTGLLVIAAAKAAAEGAGVADIRVLVREMTMRTYTFAALDTLEYIRRSGRISGLAYGLGTWLKVKPLLKMHNGQAESERIRTRGRAVERVVQLVTELGELEHLAVVHTQVPDQASAMLERVRPLVGGDYVPWCAEVTPVLGAHIGPGALGLVAVKEAMRQ